MSAVPLLPATASAWYSSWACFESGRINPPWSLRPVQFGKKWQHLRPSKRLANHNLARRINTVDLKNALGQVEADRGNLHSGWLPFCS